MRKILLFGFIIISNIAISQKIRGVGFLKIGETTIAALDSLISTGYKLKNTSDFMEYYHANGRMILQPVHSDKDKYFNFASTIPEQKIFKIGDLVIAGIEIKDIEVKFYKDTLFSIVINKYGLDFTNALKLKYGDPEIKTETKAVKCVGRISGEYTLQDIAYTSNYPVQEGIEAYDYLHKYYDDHCEEQIIHFFQIHNKSISKIVNAMELKVRKKMKASEDAQKLKSLNGF